MITPIVRFPVASDHSTVPNHSRSRSVGQNGARVSSTPVKAASSQSSELEAQLRATEERLKKAEATLNATTELLERSKNSNKPQRSTTQIDSNKLQTVDPTLSVDRNDRLISQLEAIVESFQGGKDTQIPRSGVAGEEIELEHRTHGPAPSLTQRVSETEPDEFEKHELEKQRRNKRPDVVHGDDHIDTFGNFVQDMLTAVKRKKCQKTSYSNVEVLLLSWEEDVDETDEEVHDVNKLIETEIKTVHELFETTLNFSVERFAIPIVDKEEKYELNWQEEIQYKVTTFVRKHGGPDTLIIVYYNGHGSYQGNSCFWHPTEKATQVRSGFRRPGDIEFYGPHIEWNPVQNSISARGDVLIILDCCYAGGALQNYNKGRRSTVQIMTACGKEEKTPAGPDSFTMRFVAEVNEMLARKPIIPVYELYERLFNSNLKPEPFHFLRGPGSISLERQPGPQDTEPKQQLLQAADQGRAVSRSSSVSALDQNTEFSGELSPPSADTAPTSISSAHSSSSTLVTMVVKVNDNVKPKFANWKACVEALPAEEGAELVDVKVHVEAAIPTQSTLMIVTIPLSYWVLLPHNPAYSFLSFVSGNNILLPEEPQPELSSEEKKDVAFVQRIDSDKLDFGFGGEADVVSQLVAAVVDFFEKTKSADHVKERRPGRFHQITKKIGLHPHTSKLESDPHFVSMRRLVQQLSIMRNEKGEYTSFRYDLHFEDIARLFEMKKKTMQETIHSKAGSRNKDLEAEITGAFDELEKQVLTKLEEEKKGKAYSLDPRMSVEPSKPLVKVHTRSRSSVSKVLDTSNPGDSVAPTRPSTPKSIMKKRDNSVAQRKDSQRTDSMESKFSLSKKIDSGLAKGRPKLVWRGKSTSVAMRVADDIYKRPASLPSTPRTTIS